MYWRIMILACGVAVAAESTLTRANSLYEKTEYQQALQVLDGRQDTAALALAARSRYQLGEYKAATELFEKVIAREPLVSSHHHWLGLSYGRRAETSSFLTAPKYAVICRKAFEKAVELDPKNKEAWSDLLQYYLEAPGFLGGGMAKAEDAARKLGDLDAVEREWAQARVAEKKKEYATAEQHLRKAVQLAPGDAGRLVDLARFLARRGRLAESDAEFARAAEVAPGLPKVLFEKAQTLIETGRDRPQARRLLEQYLTSRLTPDDPPRREAEKLLRKVSGARTGPPAAPNTFEKPAPAAPRARSVVRASFLEG